MPDNSLQWQNKNVCDSCIVRIWPNQMPRRMTTSHNHILFFTSAQWCVDMHRDSGREGTRPGKPWQPTCWTRAVQSQGIIKSDIKWTRRWYEQTGHILVSLSSLNQSWQGCQWRLQLYYSAILKISAVKQSQREWVPLRHPIQSLLCWVIYFPKFLLPKILT